MERRHFLGAVGSITVAGCLKLESSSEETSTSSRSSTERTPATTVAQTNREHTDDPEPTTGQPTGPEPVIERWRTEIDGGLNASPLFEDGSLYVSGSPLVALSSADGAKRWTNGDSRRLETDSKTVYSSHGRYLSAHSLDTGAVRWNRRFDPPTVPGDAELPVTTVSGLHDVQVQDGSLYVAAIGGRYEESDDPRVVMESTTVTVLHQLSDADGRTQWSVEVDGVLVGTIETADEQLVMATNKVGKETGPGTVRAHSEEDGSVLASKSFEKEINGLAVGKDTVYVAVRVDLDGYSGAGKIYALDRTDLSERWQTPVYGGGVTALTAHDQTLYFYHVFDALVSMDANQQTRWTYKPPAGVTDSPVIVDERVYVPCAEGWLVRLRDEDGAEEWGFQSFGELLKPIVRGSDIYLATWTGTVHALRDQTDPFSASITD
ncbi:PQQ-binding-like beta-propeller repeat protein [Haloarchaeobius sp. TZWSO28]|uniref:outer membrane protein assembly factor BamB family protein n=1 Tax=Haloarchaeobius sp. TZWSO28 TaxID=3446119 RepID=UPI003EBF0EA3